MLDYRETAYELMRKLREGDNPGRVLHERAIHLLRGSQDDIENASHLYKHTRRLAQSVECQNVYTRGVAELGLGWCGLIQGVGDRGNASETESWLTSAIRNLRQAHENGRAADARGEGIAFMAQGIVYQEIGDFDRALRSLTRARDILENLDDDDGLLAVVRDWKSRIGRKIVGSALPAASPTPGAGPPGGTGPPRSTPGVPPTPGSTGPPARTSPPRRPVRSSGVPGRSTQHELQILPVVDGIAAGKEIPTQDQITGYVNTSEISIDGERYRIEVLGIGRSRELKLLRDHRHFVSPVKGNSMDQANINDGDYVIIRQPLNSPPSPDNGDIVAAVIPGVGREATLKRYHKHGNQITLTPESSDSTHSPYTFTRGIDAVEIAGIAVAVLKKAETPSPD